MRFSAVGAVARGFAWLGDAALGPRISILIFHRVLPQPDPLFPGEMHARRFDALCGALSSGFNVLTLGRALTLHAAGRLPGRSVVMTFDDGYADNAEIAAPILQRHGLPATFFVATGFLDGGRMWNDTVIESLRRSTQSEVDLSALGLGSMFLRNSAERRTAIDAVLPRIKYLPLEGRAPLLQAVVEACGCPTLPHDLMMSSAQVRKLADAGMEIGGHTVRHPILTQIPDEQALDEIREGREQLQGITGQAVEVFAYPNGSPGRDYDHRHVEMARRVGYRAAVTTATGVVGRDADPFQLPRFTPWGRGDALWTARLLARRLGSTGHERAPLPA